MKAVWKKIRKTNDLRSKHVWNGLDTGYWMICPRVCHQRKSRQSEWFVIRCFHVHVADSLYLSLRCSCCCVGLAKFKLLCWGIRDVGEHMRLQCAIYLPTPSVIMALFLRSSKLIYKIPVGLPIGVYRLNLNWGQDPLSSKQKNKQSDNPTSAVLCPSSDLYNCLYNTKQVWSKHCVYKLLFLKGQ